MRFIHFSQNRNIPPIGRAARLLGEAIAPLLRVSVTAGVAAGLCLPACARQANQVAQSDSANTPVVVQPGAPGEASKKLPTTTTGTLPPRAQADEEFMQGMIMHHAQAVEMTALIPSHTKNEELRALGARISHSQSDEMRFMKRWLAARGDSAAMSMQEMGHEMPAGTAEGKMPAETAHHQASHKMALMPGMLTSEQMNALRGAKGAEFDRLFLNEMIQHHNGALTMVKELFDSAGAGQDAELFTFATDVDSGQRAEIRIMQGMLKKDSVEEKR